MHNVGFSWAYGAGLNYSPRGGEGPAKTTGTADLDDPVHPTARWRTQRANPQTRILRRTQEGGKCHRRSTSPGCQCPTSPVWSRAGAHANTNHHLVRKLFVAKSTLPRSKSFNNPFTPASMWPKRHRVFNTWKNPLRGTGSNHGIRHRSC